MCITYLLLNVKKQLAGRFLVSSADVMFLYRECGNW